MLNGGTPVSVPIVIEQATVGLRVFGNTELFPSPLSISDVVAQAGEMEMIPAVVGPTSSDVPEFAPVEGVESAQGLGEITSFLTFFKRWVTVGQTIDTSVLYPSTGIATPTVGLNTAVAFTSNVWVIPTNWQAQVSQYPYADLDAISYDTIWRAFFTFSTGSAEIMVTPLQTASLLDTNAANTNRQTFKPQYWSLSLTDWSMFTAALPYYRPTLYNEQVAAATPNADSIVTSQYGRSVLKTGSLIDAGQSIAVRMPHSAPFQWVANSYTSTHSAFFNPPILVATENATFSKYGSDQVSMYAPYYQFSKRAGHDFLVHGVRCQCFLVNLAVLSQLVNLALYSPYSTPP